LGKTSGPTQISHSRHRQISGMIFTMNFNPTWNVSAAQSSLTSLQAGSLNWPHSEDRQFGKTRWQGWQRPRLGFGNDANELTENEP
jgi:hypothetical protein